MKLAQPFIRLPFAFDAERLAWEVGQLDGAWRPHPLGLEGNSAVALITRGGGENDDFGGRMAPTPHLARCPYHQQVMAGFGEVLARSRLMRLAGGCEIQSHVDFNYHWHTRTRIHIPVVTNPGVLFFCDDREVHMRAGECWIFDNWRRHNVVNGGAEDRVHLVIDLAGSSRFWKVVREALQADPEGLGAGMAHSEPLPYAPDQQPVLLTERYNIAPVMAPGEMDALVDDLIRDFASHPGNDPELARRYEVLLRDLAHDWRETWHQHGMSREGLPHYSRLLERVKNSLHPDRRALLMVGNEVGVNPVITQRILRAALAVDAYERFSLSKLFGFMGGAGE